MKRYQSLLLCLALLFSMKTFASDDNVIEKQLQEIGTIPNEEIVVVQRKYTSKDWRSEITPLMFGGMPFGTIRRTLMSGASYTLHVNDWLAWEALNFTFSKTFFSSFTDDINNNIPNGGNTNQAKISPDYQKLLYFVTTGLQFTPFYGKVSTFSRWIAYIEPYIGLGVGLAKTESNQYFSYYPDIGVRAFFREWFSMKLEFRDYLYNEQDLPTTAGASPTSRLTNNYAVMLAFSFWLPKMP